MGLRQDQLVLIWIHARRILVHGTAPRSIGQLMGWMADGSDVSGSIRRSIGVKSACGCGRWRRTAAARPLLLSRREDFPV
jgi:hypothetical protein